MSACAPEERPSVFVSSSAVGYYGTSMSGKFTESSKPGNDYLAEVGMKIERRRINLDAYPPI